MGRRNAVVLLVCGLLWALPAQAFVSKLYPNVIGGVHGPLGCHIMRAAIVEYITGTFTAGTLATALQNKYGFTFSTEDAIDNASLVTLINAQPDLTAKMLVAFHVESLCVGWEEGFAIVDSKEEFRALLGLAAQ